MYLTFYGAAREVTGSCFLLEVMGKKVLVDCGLRQGTDVFDGEDEGFVFNAEQIDYVLLTHAHIDHSGRLPLLYKKGFRGKIITTAATAKLCEIMLLDSAHIQESDAEWRNRKGQRSGEFAVQPLYTTEDAEKVSRLFHSYEYGQEVELFHGCKVVFTDAGHLLGSSSVTVYATEEDVTKPLVFSGDIGNSSQPLLNDPVYLKKADYIVMESTYADRIHDPADETEDRLAEFIQSTLDAGGNLVIPSFAVGRTQEILYFIRNIKKLGKVHGHDGFPVVVDSPLAVDATHIFEEVGEKYYDEYAGQVRTSDRAHKVTVPQTVLDAAKKYAVCSKAMLSEQGFSGLFGASFLVSSIFLLLLLTSIFLVLLLFITLVLISLFWDSTF